MDRADHDDTYLYEHSTRQVVIKQMPMAQFRLVAPLVLVFVLPCLHITSVQAQSVDPQDNSPDDVGLWLAVFDRGNISHDGFSDMYRWWFDGHLRLFDDSGGFGQSIVRPGIGYALNDQTTVWAGYGWIRTSPARRPDQEKESNSDIDEHRLWQQITWSQKLEPVTVGLRSRMEERFFDTESETALRFRQLLSWRHALESESGLSLVIWDEVFINLNDTSTSVNGFDQNRLFLGFGRKSGSTNPSRTEIGYLYQRVGGSAGSILNNHLLSVNFYMPP